MTDRYENAVVEKVNNCCKIGYFFNDRLHLSFLAGPHIFRSYPAYTTTEIGVRTKCSSICLVSVEYTYNDRLCLSFFGLSQDYLVSGFHSNCCILLR